MDSFRYFELDFCFEQLGAMGRIERLLDVSSPRVFPLLLITDTPTSEAHLLNPDPGDLSLTQALAAAWGLEDRCAWHEEEVAAVPLEEASMDVITSISVVEHAADDQGALQAMWRLVRPGGRLLVTVPVAAEAFEEYMDLDVYGTSPVDPAGWSFASRYYDETHLRSRLLSVVGEPSCTVIYGEREPGRFFAMRRRKWIDPRYPYWLEPYVMATQFRRFDSIAELPGIGVLGIEWVKPRASDA